MLDSTRSRLLAAVFILSAFTISYWFVQHIPHPVVIHVNDKWHIMLVGESDTSSVQFYSNQFDLVREDRANIWLSGKGRIKWHDHTITITRASVRLNNKTVSTNIQEAEVNIMFYPDGRVTKGTLNLK